MCSVYTKFTPSTPTFLTFTPYVLDTIYICFIYFLGLSNFSSLVLVFIPELNEEDLSVVLKENANKGYNKKPPQGLLICNGYIF